MIIELIGSLSIAIGFVSLMILTIIHARKNQNDVSYIHEIDRSQMKMNHLREEASLPFEQSTQVAVKVTSSSTSLTRKRSIVNVIQVDKTSLSSVKYGIQWKFPNDEEMQSEKINSSLTNIENSSEYDQTDSLSFGDQAICVRNLIEKFENNPLENKLAVIESDLTSIDSQTIKTDRNQNQQKISHHSSISNLDITIPSNISSSIDLEQFESFSTTSNLSEFLITN
ncbi:unnamed protein product [Adineta ricciae]|uniref:Uncharacterized protein n=1 Tax=Adineta ricciae TaxID=249248 RepID=A0A813RE04_ADIRI|nr:unnamed protein product [Adineta ricciae]CAF1532511.1 unnamed protein product [Adineta ricciae]